MGFFCWDRSAVGSGRGLSCRAFSVPSELSNWTAVRLPSSALGKASLSSAFESRVATIRSDSTSLRTRTKSLSCSTTVHKRRSLRLLPENLSRIVHLLESPKARSRKPAENTTFLVRYSVRHRTNGRQMYRSTTPTLASPEVAVGERAKKWGTNGFVCGGCAIQDERWYCRSCHRTFVVRRGVT